MSFTSLLKKLFSLTLILIGIILVLYAIPAVPGNLITYSWYNLIFYFVLSVTVGYIIYLGIRNNSTQTFLLSLMVTFFLKLLACIGFFVGIYYALDVEPKIFFVPFGAFYLIYTIFETAQLYRYNSYLTSNATTKQK